MQHDRGLAAQAPLRVGNARQTRVDGRLFERQADGVVAARGHGTARWTKRRALARRRALGAGSPQQLHGTDRRREIALGAIQILYVLDGAVVDVRRVHRPWAQLIGRDAGAPVGSGIERVVDHVRIDSVEHTTARELGEEAIDLAADFLGRAFTGQAGVFARHHVHERALAHGEHHVLLWVARFAALGERDLDVEEAALAIELG